MNNSNLSLEIIKATFSECGSIQAVEFTRAKDNISKIISPIDWDLSQKKNILNLTGSGELAIVCTRCLSTVKSDFNFFRSYKIFNTTVEANNYDDLSNKFEAIAVEEKPTILILLEDEILFEFLKIVNHSKCYLPESKYPNDSSHLSHASSNLEIINPFSKLKEKFHK